MAPDTPRIAVVIPTFERADRIPPLLAALHAQTLAPDRFEVVLVDDSSRTESWLRVQAAVSTSPLRARALRTSRNGGPALARNTGWRMTSAPVVAFIDDDCLPDAGWLAAGLAAFDAKPRLGVVQGHTAAPAGTDFSRLGDWYLWRVIEAAGPFFEGCNIFYRRAALEASGGFDEEIRWWGEDTALGWRVVEQGWERDFAPDARVVHEVDRRGWRCYLHNGISERNLIHLAARHPRYRAEAFWRPWAFRRDDAAFVLAVLGMAAAIRVRPAAMLSLPYLWWRRPSVRQPGFFRLCLQIPAVDAARCVGQVRGAIESRILVI